MAGAFQKKLSGMTSTGKFGKKNALQKAGHFYVVCC
jgi:hypothetical protein